VKVQILGRLKSQDKMYQNLWSYDYTLKKIKLLFFLFCELMWALALTLASSLMKVLDHTQRRIMFVRTPLDEWSARRRQYYLTKHKSHETHLYLGGIRTHKPRNPTAVDPRLRPRGSWSRAEPLAQYVAQLWNSKKRFWYRLLYIIREQIIHFRITRARSLAASD